ncbi:hypothetical protein PMZ80_001116 [Knufia obscura]|uniref:Uncharacterized protein n=2 Tax=Knufia TaxID=430999 RepID=A0AAN8I9G1_9EURO|nr:hypothetical protein PMZ80_001116 [Knufia obscura]KAK5958819.1 hypothetical protein OHC33_000662 [Knufia fluminis]
MPVTSKQKHLARAPQEYYDLRVQLAFQRVHLKAICHRYDNEIAELFPNQDLVYKLFDQIVAEHQAYRRTEKKLSKVGSRLRWTGNPEEDSKKDEERANIGYTVRKLHWGDRQDDAQYPSPPNTPSPPPSPPPPTPDTVDVWTTFRDTTATNNNDEDSPRKSTKRVHFAELPLSSKRTWLKKLTDKVEDIAYGVATTPLLHAGWGTTDTTTVRRTTSSPKKRACVDDDYVPLPDYSPTKKAKKAHAIPWPEAYLFEDLDVFKDCEDGSADVDQVIVDAVRRTRNNEDTGDEEDSGCALSSAETMSSPTLRARDKEGDKLLLSKFGITL